METSSDRLLVEGTKEELLTELRRLAVGWRHLGRDDKAREVDQAIHDLLVGRTSVCAGHTFYDVT